MIKIIDDIIEQRERIIKNEDISIFGYIQMYLDNVIKVGGKVKVFRNGKELLTSNYDYVPVDNDDIEVRIVPGAIAIPFLINMAISLAISFVMSKLFSPDVPNPDKIEKSSVYDFDISEMKYSKGVITEVFGETTVFPELLSAPYSKYVNNEEVIYMTMQIGRGDVSINEMLLNKNDISDTILKSVDKPNYPVTNGVEWMSSKQPHMSFKKLYNSDKFELDDDYQYVVSVNKSIKNLDIVNFDPTPGQEELKFEKGERTVKTEDGTTTENGIYVDLNNLPNLPDYSDEDGRYFISESIYDPEIQDLPGTGVISNPDNDTGGDLGYYLDFDLDSIRWTNNEIGTIEFSTENLPELQRYTVPSKILSKHESTNLIEIDVLHSSGIYRTNSEGKVRTTTVEFDCELIKYDENGEVSIVSVYNYVKTDNTGKAKRITFSFNEFYENDLYVRFKNKTRKANTAENVVNNTIIKQVKTVMNVSKTIKDKNVSYATLKLSTAGHLFSDNNKLNISFLVSRMNYNKLSDVIKYIWEESGYSWTDIKNPEILDGYLVNGQIENQDLAIRQIDKILRSYRLIITSGINGFRIKKDGIKPIRSYIFDKSNVVKNSLTETHKSADLKSSDGFKVNYLDKTGRRKNVTFPDTSLHPTEVNIFGVDDEIKALEHAKIGWNRMIKSGSSVKFRTSKVGFIPTVEDRIGISKYYLDKNLSTSEIIGSDGSNRFRLDKDIFIGEKNGDSYTHCVIKFQDGTTQQVGTIIYEGSDWTNEVTLNGIEIPVSKIRNTKINIISGNGIELIEDYVVKKIINVSETEVEIQGEIYDETVFN